MNRKGFTLIELLAVILILGIIALIAIPTVNKIIESTKLNSFIRTGNAIVNAIEDECSANQLRGEKTNITYYFDGETSQKIEVKGKLPQSGGVTTNNECQSTLNISDGTYCAIKAANSDRVVGGKIKDGYCKLDEEKKESSICQDTNPGEFSGDGSTSNPYLIESIEDLYKLRTMPQSNSNDKHFKLAIDLDFNDDSSYCDISNKIKYTTGTGFDDGKGTYFNGNFDGNNKTIKNLYINNKEKEYTGLFTQIGVYTNSKLYFKNLTLVNSYINGRNFVGSIAGFANATKIKLSNINVIGSVNGNNSIGGLFGKVTTDSAFDSDMINSMFNGNVTCSSSYCGGIIGDGNGSAMNLYNLTSMATISSGSTYVGGIAGKYYKGRLDKLFSYGKIENVDGVNKNFGYVGGIIGDAGSATIVSNLYNYINITENYSTMGPVGGIFGNNNNMEGNDLYNYGNINTPKMYRASGIASSVYKCTNCYNYGNITGNQYVSGMSSEEVSNSICINCANYGNIIATNYNSNGYMANGLNFSKIYNSINYGNIECDYECAGLSNNVIELKNSYSLGNVIARDGGTYMSKASGGFIEGTTITNSYIKSNISTTKSPTSGFGNKLLSGGTISNSAFIGGITLNDPTSANLFVKDNVGTLNNVYYSKTGGNVSTGVGTSVPFANITTSWFKDTLKLGDNFLYEEGYYPRVYKIDTNGNVTNELVEGQTKVAIR